MDDILGDGARLLDAMTRSEYERASAKITAAPLELTDHDFVTLTNFGSKGEASRAWEARRLAQLALVRASGGSYASTTPAAPLDTKTAADPQTDGDRAWDAFVKSHGAKPVIWPAFGDAVNQIFDCLKSHKRHAAKMAADVTSRFENVEARMSALELAHEHLAARLAALEDKPSVKFCGTFQSGRTYAPGDACTHHGGLWVCKAATSGAPGADFVGWTLAVKRGAAR
jgi:hypothetical protein